MTAADVSLAVDAKGLNHRDFCRFLDVGLPVMRELAEKRVWYIRLGMKALISALDGYRKETCG